MNFAHTNPMNYVSFQCQEKHLIHTFDRPPILWYDGITKGTEVSL